MITNYFIVVSATTALTLIWRALKDDHPKLKHLVERLPVLGGTLSCGFCVAMWSSLAAVLLVNPLDTWALANALPWPNIATLLAGWLTVSTGVLFQRSIVIVLLEGGAVLKHMHTQGH